MRPIADETKRDHTWIDDKAHASETGDDDEVHLIIITKAGAENLVLSRDEGMSECSFLGTGAGGLLPFQGCKPPIICWASMGWKRVSSSHAQADCPSRADAMKSTLLTSM